MLYNSFKKRGETMLNTEEMIKIALSECVEMLGKDLVDKHKEKCCGAYRMTDSGLFSYALGLDTKNIDFTFGKETPMEFYACVIVDPKTGKITRDYKKSVLPS